jgi:hypothetical protein
MRRLIITIVLFTGIIFAQSQVEKFTPQLDDVISNTNQNEELLVWVFFSDKGNETQSYFQKPSTVVSEKSLKRRAKVLSDDKLISTTDLPVNQNYIDQIQSLGFRLKQKTKWFNGISGWVTKTELVQISNLSFVKQFDIVYRFKNDKSEEEILNDFPEEINQNLSKPLETHSFNYGESYTQLNQITVPQVHDLGYTGAGVTICMMDAGFDLWTTHQVFDSMNVIATWDFVNGDPDVENGSDMGEGSHGCATLSLIGGFYQGELIGPAFGADFILAKTENTDSETPIEEDNWIAAMEWADSIGVDVTSTSLSYLDYDPPYPSYTWEDMDGNTTYNNWADWLLGRNFVATLQVIMVYPIITLGHLLTVICYCCRFVTSNGTRQFQQCWSYCGRKNKPDLMAMGNDYML